MEKIKDSFLKKLLVCIIIVISTLAIHNFSNAVTVTTKTGASKTFNLSKMMPQNNTTGGSGMFPQYYVSGAVRNVTLDESRWNLNTNKWQASMSGKVVYCADYHAYVRYGFFEGQRIYLRKTRNNCTRC